MLALLSLSVLYIAGLANSQTTTNTNSPSPTIAPCLCTEYAQILPAVASCLTLTLSNIHAPVSSALVLTKLKTGATVIFDGTTTFGFTNSSQFRPIQIAGSNVTIRGTEGSVIDGGGEMYWDGLGSNGGLPK